MTGHTRTFRWRTHAYLGGHLLDQEFSTAAEAGEWRRENFPEPDANAPLTLSVFEDGERSVTTAEELAAAHWAWLNGPHHDDESAAAPVEPRPAA